MIKSNILTHGTADGLQYSPGVIFVSNLQIIEALCQLVEMQSRVISMLAKDLEQMRELTEAETAMIAKVKEDYTAILGSGEDF